MKSLDQIKLETSADMRQLLQDLFKENESLKKELQRVNNEQLLRPDLQRAINAIYLALYVPQYKDPLNRLAHIANIVTPFYTGDE